MSIAFNYSGNCHYGSFPGDPVGYILTTSLGGTAAAGDILIVNAMGGADGDGLNGMQLYDNVDGTGADWHRLTDQQVQPGTPNTNTLYNVFAWKLAVGGETSVTIQFIDSSNKAMEVLWISDAASVGLNEAYLIAGPGAGAFNPGPGHIELAPGNPTSDGEVYVGWTDNARDGYSYADLNINGGAHGADTGAGQSLSGAAYVIIHHWYGGGAGLATDTVGYGINILNNPWMGVAGVRAGTPSVEGASDGGLLLGDADPSVTPGGIHGESDGGVLLGTADATVAGGDVQARADGGVLLGAPSPSVVLRPGPPVPVPAITNVLGCGVYEVLAFTRGGGEVVGSLEFDNLSWARQLDATSSASMVIDGVTNLGALQRCCETLGSLNPWEHELAIYRQVPGSTQKRRVWMGPITRMRFPNESVVIEALDLSGWLQRRTLHQNHNFVAIDLINMWVAWVEDAMGVDNSPGLYPTVLALSGILADRLTTIVDHSYAADAIAEIATTGIDWTVIDRVMQAGPVLPQPDFDAIDSLPLLLDEAFRVAPEIIVDGMSGANCWFVNGGGTVSNVSIFGEYGPAFASTPDHVSQPAAPDFAAIQAQYGRIELVVSETRILDQPSIDQAAKTRYELTRLPVPYITGGELVPTAPLPIDQIVPGALLRVKLNRACKPIDQVMRIQSVAVSANADGSESVDLGLEPIGTVSNG